MDFGLPARPLPAANAGESGGGPARPYAEPVVESRRGLALGVAAYAMWGAFP